MAMSCVTGARECDGCQRCQETSHTTCEGCGEEIYEGEDCYRIGSVWFCEDCVTPAVWEADTDVL